MKKTGLYFGSFNPVHIGHLILAEHVISCGRVDELWLIVSPQNPLKSASELAPETDRLNMLNIAVTGNDKIIVSDIEFHLSKPSFTANTLRHLVAMHTDREFVVVLGEDIKQNFHLWKDYEWILENFEILLYPRFSEHPIQSPIDWSRQRIVQLKAPRIEVSATQIRQLIKNKQSCKYLVADGVIAYIAEQGLYL